MNSAGKLINKIKALFVLIILTLFITPMASAQVALYKVADEDTTLYFMGTIHLLPQGTNWTTPKIKKAFDSADTLVVEVSQSLMTPAATQPLIMKYGFLPQGHSLEQYLSAETYAKVKGIFGANPAAMAQINRMQPWLVGITLTMGEFVKAGFDPNSGVDKMLEKLATEKGKKIQSLESAEFQMKTLANMGKNAKGGMLGDIIDNLPNAKDEVMRMKDLWLAGDMDGLATMANKEFKKYPEMLEGLLYARNRNWMVEIDQMMAMPGTKFIAVGAGHLAGEKSVIDLLKKAGITVERIQ